MDLSRFSMEGRTTIITGGSGGIGRCCALAFAQAGSNVMIASLPAESIPPVVREVEALGVGAAGLAVDVSNEDQVKDLVAATLDRFGRIDALLNVAGGSYSRNPEMPAFQRGTLLELSPEDFMGVYDVNVKTAFLCSKAVVPHMKERGKGAIVNIG
ncbi:MAG: SDR family NAD(P)-dependent oxidoreductase, partial [Deltaproteobacteria bacterium]|nr:SDR family NAD(P)-dependent oxidoreductase [Deltaproteobacteria bacterium]